MNKHDYLVSLCLALKDSGFVSFLEKDTVKISYNGMYIRIFLKSIIGAELARGNPELQEEFLRIEWVIREIPDEGKREKEKRIRMVGDAIAETIGFLSFILKDEFESDDNIYTKYVAICDVIPKYSVAFSIVTDIIKRINFVSEYYDDLFELAINPDGSRQISGSTSMSSVDLTDFWNDIKEIEEDRRNY
nr:hypothetical protein [Clostridia bacterium]